VRRKSKHFAAFNQVVDDFAQLLHIDPWLINPYFGLCENVNFQERTGEQCMAEQVDLLLGRIRSKYKEYGIAEDAFVIVKADAGTYGMGVMSVTDASQVMNLNRKQRNKMAVVKEGLEVSQVLLQEGVPTIEQLEGSSAEPVVYMVDRYVVGGFYRVHQSRIRQESLNAPGMHFVPLPFATSCIRPDDAEPPEAAPNRFYAYGVVARLALPWRHRLNSETKLIPSSVHPSQDRTLKRKTLALRRQAPCNGYLSWTRSAASRSRRTAPTR
jgi:glutamate--cysteine ligase